MISCIILFKKHFFSTKAQPVFRRPLCVNLFPLYIIYSLRLCFYPTLIVFLKAAGNVRITKTMQDIKSAKERNCLSIRRPISSMIRAFILIPGRASFIATQILRLISLLVEFCESYEFSSFILTILRKDGAGTFT